MRSQKVQLSEVESPIATLAIINNRMQGNQKLLWVCISSDDDVLKRGWVGY